MKIPYHDKQPPKLRFDAADQMLAWDVFGANCGPGAVAAALGLKPAFVALLLSDEFLRRRATTEVMLTRLLTDLEVPWTLMDSHDVQFGILRVQWSGPWDGSADPYEPLGHSHWVTVWRSGGRTEIFDVNAISVGGWLAYSEWSQDLVPWLLEREEPEANGSWWFSDGYSLGS